jgi:DNA adenine methylase
MSEPKVYHRSKKTGGSDNWGTPPELFEILDREFGFTIDLAAEAHNAKCDRYYSAEDNALAHDWSREIGFLNPPYSKIKAWVSKASAEAQRGALIVALLPARVGTSWWVENVAPAEVRLLPGRLRFIDPDGSPAENTAGFPSAIVIFGRNRGPSTLYWDYRETGSPADIVDDRARPALRYYGAKFALAPWIIDHFPAEYPGLHYIEPYGGSAGVLLRKAPSRLETYNDLDHRLVTFFRVLRDRPEELTESLSLTPYARAEYEGARNPAGDPEVTDLEVARRVYTEYWLSIAGSPVRPGFKVQRSIAGRYTPAPAGFIKATSYLPRLAERLRGVQIENINALELIKRVDGADTLLYVDPPYPAETRKHERSYSHEMGARDHKELAGLLSSYSGYVLISGYDSAEYRDLYDSAGWYRATRKTRDNSGAKQALEVLWLNPRLAEELREIGSPAGSKISNDAPPRWVQIPLFGSSAGL